MAEIAFPIRVLASCGVRVLVLTNAAGAINPSFQLGDFMAAVDHLNFMGDNPLRGEGGLDSFVDLRDTYDPKLNKLLTKAARQARVRLHSGVYIAVAGPCYETPAEIKAFAKLGADVVGMSTVPEAIVARACGLRVAALSCITNGAAGLNSAPICHAEVLAAGKRGQGQARKLLTAFVKMLASSREVAMAP
jgi:purine-nucleoside phosphorylase